MKTNLVKNVKLSFIIRIVSFIILLAVVTALIPPSVSADEYSSLDVITIPVVSDLGPLFNTVDLLIKETSIYVQSSMAEVFSGFTVTSSSNDAVVFEKEFRLLSESGEVLFERSCEKYSCQDVIHYEDPKYSIDGEGYMYYQPDTYWVPLSATLEELFAKVEIIDNILVVSGREWTPQSALAFIDYTVFGEGNGLEDSKGFDIAMNIGYDADSVQTKKELFKGAIWDGIIEEKAIEMLTPKYEQDNTEEILYDILKMDDALSSSLSEAERVYKSVSKVSKNTNLICKALLTACAMIGEEKLITDVTDMDEIMDFFIGSNCEVASFSGAFYSFSKTTNELLDSVGTVVEDATGLKVKGLDIGSQLSVILHWHQLQNCSELASNSILYTYYYNNQLESDFTLRPAQSQFISKLYDLKSKPSTATSWEILAEEELKTIVSKTAISSIESFVEDNVIDRIIGPGTTIYAKAAALIIKAISGAWNASGYYSWVNKWPLLVEQQNTAMCLYHNYRSHHILDGEDCAINAKYAALLYLKYFLLNNEYQIESNIGIHYDIEFASRLYSAEEIAATAYAIIADISDSDLTEKPSNRRLTTETLSESIKNSKIKYCYFGTYPQTLVEDLEIISTLNTIAERTGSWNSYDYFVDGAPSDFMVYKDLWLNGTRYRGVYFSDYRPISPSSHVGAVQSPQKENGYEALTIYWYKFEPIKWVIVDSSDGSLLLVSTMILDSQPFRNFYKSYNTSWTTTSYYTDSSRLFYADNYAESDIRIWLNKDFFNTAFGKDEQNKIITSLVSNGFETTLLAESDRNHVSEDTSDNVFLLSNSEVQLYKEFLIDGMLTTGRKEATAYALVQGYYTFSSGWLLRSPRGWVDGWNGNYVYSCNILSNDFMQWGIGYVNGTGSGISPAIRIIKASVSNELGD